MKSHIATGHVSFHQADVPECPVRNMDLVIDPVAIFHHLQLMRDSAEEAFIYRRRIEWLREYGVPSPNFPRPPEHHLRTQREWEMAHNFEAVRLAAVEIEGGDQ